MEEGGERREEVELRKRCSERQMEISEEDLLRSDRYLLQEGYNTSTGMRTMTI